MLGFSAHAEQLPISYDKVMNVDGFDLKYACKGTGEPVTVIEPPSGNASEEVFKNLFDDIAKYNKTCVYARLGNGDDKRAFGLNLSGVDYLRQLEKLVELEAKGQPLILVGYSYGSFVARLYASKYSDTVKGLLLIDPPHHQWVQALKAQMSPQDWQKMSGILTWFKENKGHNYWDTQFEVAETKLPIDLPVALVSRGLDEIKIKKANLTEKGFRLFNDLYFKYIEEFKTLTKQTVHFKAPNSRHLILEHEPEVVVNAYKKLLELSESINGYATDIF